ncbi:MAG: RHS repeat-associated core domain-containing protein [Streptosporangiaceae bacterium]
MAGIVTSAGNYHATTNWLGSVTGLVSSAGAQVSSATYATYGAPATTGSPVSPIGFAGSYPLPGSGGLDDMHARDYSPAAGAFTSVDPALALGGQPYAYAGDSPASQTDPSGTCPSWLPCSLISDVVSGAKLVGTLAEAWADHSFGGSESAAFFVTTPRGVSYKIPDGWIRTRSQQREGDSIPAARRPG